jgi:zinc transport system ATP-binding protein
MLKSNTFRPSIKVMSPTSNDPLVTVNDVSLKLKGRLILDKINLSVFPNEIVSVIGPNGSGKTTLIKIMVGLIAPTFGVRTIQTDLRIGYMPQRLHIDPIFPISVERFLRLNTDMDSAQIKAQLTLVGVTHVLNRNMSKLSGGEFQRVLLARALLRNPQLLVLDEPVQGVDVIGQGELYDLIGAIRDQKQCAVVLVSHDLHVVMAKTNRVVCLNQHICCLGSPEKVSRDPAFAQMFGSAAMGFAFYTHKHDHQHDPQGTIVTKEKKNDD